ncbi:MAG: phenylacetate--CoA ligase family protein [bacterium]|nr:phenylacetate--CoA ligase family protein [bacterium]
MTIYASLLRRFALPWTLSRDNRQSALAHWRFFEESQFWSRSQLLEYQQQKLTALIRHAYDTTPYYKRIFDERGLKPTDIRSADDLVKLPILARKDLFDHGNDIRSRSFSDAQTHKLLTGGTTGQQAVLYRDQESLNIKLGMAWRHEHWVGAEPCDKMAYYWPAHIDFHHDESLKQRIKQRYVLRQLMSYTGGGSEDSLGQVYRDSVAFNPRMIKAFPSALLRFTEYLKQHNLKYPRLVGIMSTGEVLYQRDKELFEEFYQCRVFDMYGSRETGNTACECNQHRGRHIAVETSLLEVVKDGQPLPADQDGEYLITDLTNYGFPLIRYQINDYGRILSESCSCGRHLPMMGSTVGRTHDRVTMLDGREINGNTLLYHLTTDDVHRIGQLQIVQQQVTRFLIRVNRRPEPTEATFAFIRGQMRKLLGDIEVLIEVVDEIPRDPSGKVRSLISELGKVSSPDRG